MSANDRQPGGDHYQPKDAKGIQHWDLMADNEVPYLEGNASKYIYRWRRKNGAQDLEKFVHYVEKVIEKTQYTSFGGSRVDTLQLITFMNQEQMDSRDAICFATILSWRTVTDLEMCLTIGRALLAEAKSGSNMPTVAQ